MKIVKIRLQNYRNIAFVDLDTIGDNHYLCGLNGQGKTNVLEGVSLVTALRSFRTQSVRNLINWDHVESKLLLEIDHEKMGRTEVGITLRSKQKEVSIDGEKIKKFSDFVGRFPSVLMSSQDIQLLRGAPQMRRRFLDLILSAVDIEYLQALRRYHRALQDRNQILKRGGDSGQLRAFEGLMAEAGIIVMKKRYRAIACLEGEIQKMYNGISQVKEEPRLFYKADQYCEAREDFLQMLEENRNRDSVLKTTSRGPHRDDFSLGILGKEARDFGSEGQQRGLVIALRFAQLNYFRDLAGIQPVVLADDILGELDEFRRIGFWEMIGDDIQVFASGTDSRLPDSARAWKCFKVEKGVVTPYNSCS